MTQDDVFRLASKSIAGLTEFGVALTIAHCTPATLTTLRTTAAQKRAAHDSARAAKTQAYLTIRTARENVAEYLAKARDHLKPLLGPTWSGLWTQLGFTNQNLTIPRPDEERLDLLSRFQTYFSANPTHENAVFDITALRGEAVSSALFTARQAVINCVHDTRTKREDRDAAIADLLKKLRCLWNELGSVMEPTDPRWLKFIDRIPGDPRVPEQVEDIVAATQPGGVITLDWPDVQRAARYKVIKQVVGVDTEPVLVETVEDSDAQVTGVPSGAIVKLQIVATNSVGDAPASEVIQLQAA